MTEATDDYETKARHLRRLYRRIDGDEGTKWQALKAEYERLFPDPEVRLDQILVNAWTEARELAGWRYDYNAQHWLRADGSAVINDDGSEWRHL